MPRLESLWSASIILVIRIMSSWIVFCWISKKKRIAFRYKTTVLRNNYLTIVNAHIGIFVTVTWSFGHCIVIRNQVNSLTRITIVPGIILKAIFEHWTDHERVMCGTHGGYAHVFLGIPKFWKEILVNIHRSKLLNMARRPKTTKSMNDA